MKTLYIVRHAKSSWDQPGIADFDRPLNDRGKRDAPRMGKRLKDKHVHPGLMLSSPAKRALSTCKRIAEALGYPAERIKTERALYHADEDEILSVVRSIKDKHDVLMIFGHNPGLTDFVNRMSRDKTLAIDNIPTCGIVVFRFNITSWQEADFGKGELLLYDYPKKE